MHKKSNISSGTPRGSFAYSEEALSPRNGRRWTGCDPGVYQGIVAQSAGKEVR